MGNIDPAEVGELIKKQQEIQDHGGEFSLSRLKVPSPLVSHWKREFDLHTNDQVSFFIAAHLESVCVKENGEMSVSKEVFENLYEMWQENEKLSLD